MIPERLFALREQMYEAWGIYHQALGAYWSAINQRYPPESVRLAADLVRTTGASLDQALSVLLSYLRQMEPGEGTGREIQHASRIQELLSYEMELLERQS
jgi:hypothetical protein